MCTVPAQALDLAIRSMQFSERLQKGSSQTCPKLRHRDSSMTVAPRMLFSALRVHESNAAIFISSALASPRPRQADQAVDACLHEHGGEATWRGSFCEDLCCWGRGAAIARVGPCAEIPDHKKSSRVFCKLLSRSSLPWPLEPRCFKVCGRKHLMQALSRRVWARHVVT